MSTFPFNDVNDIDLYWLLQLQHNVSSNSVSDEQYEQNISNAFNNNLEEIEYALDVNDISFVKSRWVFYWEPIY